MIREKCLSQSDGCLEEVDMSKWCDACLFEAGLMSPITYIRCGNTSCANEVILHEDQVEQAQAENWLCDYCEIRGGYSGN